MKDMLGEDHKTIKECFASLEAQNKTLEWLKGSDIILGHDTDTDNIFTVFGRTRLQAIVADKPSQCCTFAVVSLRQATTELEMLLAAVQVAKGYEEYLATGEDGSTRGAEVEEIERMFALIEGNNRIKAIKGINAEFNNGDGQTQ